MKLTKYGHSCVIIENQSEQRMIIDPGNLTILPEDLTNINLLVCTHLHQDHLFVPNIERILEINPSLTIYAPEDATSSLDGLACDTVAIGSEMTIDFGGVELILSPCDHAVIWQKSPCKNLRLRVGDFYYYPGDSFGTIDSFVEILGAPISAPWLKISESIEFARSMNCKKIVPVHDGLLNQVGQGIINRWISVGLEDQDKELVILEEGESV
ncbi:MBL fold metallo-hydrolase [Candidatus Saccharibacteria bacterium]|nr:MBL fold metallo-hydrolase [Candidatus Saccharibacteria bacterium]